MKGRSRAMTLAMAVVFAFLYLPIVILIVYSFNAGRFVTVWGGVSVKWYGALFANSQLIAAAWLSLRIAVASATVATVIGVMAGYALARFKRFPGRMLFSILLIAPILLPEVITGMSLLLLFVESEQLAGWPSGRGVFTVIVSHITFTLPCAALVMRARFNELDVSLEEAALDLGAPPWKVYFVITLPLIAPALISGWLLAFTMSLDDLVISSFVSGPGSSTLPMVVFSMVRRGLSPEINALATLFIAAIGIGIIASVAIARRGFAPPR